MIGLGTPKLGVPTCCSFIYLCKKTGLGKDKYSNVLIIAGTGRNSGKTMLACMIIQKFRELKPVAIKISPHFHEPTDGLVSWHEGADFNIFRETSSDSGKDSSRMLDSGASEVYFIQAYDKFVSEAFKLVRKIHPPDRPIICESPSLPLYIEPGILLLCDNKEKIHKKDISHLIDQAARIYYPLIHDPDLDGLGFAAGRWFIS